MSRRRFSNSSKYRRKRTLVIVQIVGLLMVLALVLVFRDYVGKASGEFLDIFAPPSDLEVKKGAKNAEGAGASAGVAGTTSATTASDETATERQGTTTPADTNAAKRSDTGKPDGAASAGEVLSGE
jgi:hypothetical protein